MEKLDRERVVSVIVKAYSEYPETQETIETMIDQALMIGFIKGKNYYEGREQGE